MKWIIVICIVGILALGLELKLERAETAKLEAEIDRIYAQQYYDGLQERNKLMNESLWASTEANGGYVRRNKDGGATIWIVPSEADSARRVDSLLAVPPKDTTNPPAIMIDSSKEIE